MSNVIVRDYGPADLQACLAVFDSNVPRYFTPAERAGYAAFLRALPGPYLVLEDDGDVVGCGGHALNVGSDVADLCWGMVRQSLHRRGLGRLLTDVRIRRAVTDPRVTAIRLDTSQHTVRFYELSGFRVIRVDEDGYAPGLHRCEMRVDVDRIR